MHNDSEPKEMCIGSMVGVADYSSLHKSHYELSEKNMVEMDIYIYSTLTSRRATFVYGYFSTFG